MKKISYLSLVFLCCAFLGSCTNDEDDEKIDILTPTEQTILAPVPEPSENP
jgi:hypothetical protein